MIETMTRREPTHNSQKKTTTKKQTRLDKERGEIQGLNTQVNKANKGVELMNCHDN